ncbi:hypothetical protein [Staphylococcus auricularis]|uniref:Uncharacterized protein n=1 Tax=Staphylococcus auricularis TaxID=29379 RepID=A0AAW7MAQ5_9STAP|nr:hypothetical protein [Staphylococcus auricularis]MBM0868931.1 hypothetical protein [Staphylococcus auricularis]MDC6328247.1 hypothetical protein [Staphylococcus auricularis]MDN4532162.1 hypothetical protein [Staphylococcus auricularis]
MYTDCSPLVKLHLKQLNKLQEFKTLLRNTTDQFRYIFRDSSYFQMPLESFKSSLQLNTRPITIKLNIQEFSSTLFSEKIIDFIKKSITLTDNIVDDAFRRLRYEYVKNTLFRTKSICQISWEPIMVWPIESQKQRYTKNDKDVFNEEGEKVENIQKLAPFLQDITIDFLLDIPIESFQDFITLMANNLLPFIPYGFRDSLLALIIFIIVFNPSTKH